MIGDFCTILLDGLLFKEGPIILIVLMAPINDFSYRIERSIREWLNHDLLGRTTLEPEDTTLEHSDKFLFGDIHTIYLRLFQRVLKQGLTFDHTAAASLHCTTLYSILRYQVVTLQARYRDAWNCLLKVKTNDESFTSLSDKRSYLRRAIEEFEDGLQCVRSYVRLRSESELVSAPRYQEFEEHWGRVVPLSRRLKSEIRDQMQLTTAELSIDESRKSIELSNVQIREGKQGQSSVSITGLHDRNGSIDKP